MDKAEILKKVLKGSWLVAKWTGIGVAYISKAGYQGTKKGVAYFNRQAAVGGYICDPCKSKLEKELSQFQKDQKTARKAGKDVPTKPKTLDHSDCKGSIVRRTDSFKNASGEPLPITFNCVCNSHGHQPFNR